MTQRTILTLLLALAIPLGEARGQAPPDLAVRSVDFDGNHALDDYTLAAAIATSPSAWTWRLLHLGERRPFDELELKRDVVRLQLLYRQRGFYDARIDTTIRRGEKDVAVKFRIEEGPPVVVDSVEVLGLDSVPGGRRLGGRVVLRVGRPFDRLLFDASADSIAFALRDRGYPWAEVFRNYQIDRVNRTARVSFVAEPRVRSRVGSIAIQGNSAVSESVIRRWLAFSEGDGFRQQTLFESQRSLYQSGLFRYASVAVVRDTAGAGDSDSLVTVRVQVAEAPAVQSRLGLGYGTIDCFRAQGSMSFLNFLGASRRLDLVSRVSKIGVGLPLQFENSLCPELAGDPFSDRLNYLGSITLTQPAFPVRRAALSVSAFAEQRSELRAYRVQSVGGTMSLRFGFGRLVPFSLAYRVSNDETHAEPATYCKYFNQCDAASLARFSAPRREASLSLSLVSTHTDLPLEPTSGSTFSLELTTAQRALGSDIAFDRAVAEAIGYHRLARGTVLAARVRVGIIRPGTSEVDTALAYVPAGDRFYAGGPTTVRGFARNEMGPQVYVVDTLYQNPAGDTTYVNLRASPVGSYGILLANVELRLPTPIWGGRVGVNLFADAGRLWDYDGSYLPGEFRVTPGMGVQVSTPLGPMRLDAAYNGGSTTAGPLYQVSGNNLVARGTYPGQKPGATFLKRLQFHFSVGIAF